MPDSSPPARPAAQGAAYYAIAQDYRAKLDDLGRKNALRLTARWVQTQEVLLPVQRLTVQIRRRKAERVMTMDWNPLLHRLESPPCDANWPAERPRLVCDEPLHLVVPAGLAPCASCGRAYCRPAIREPARNADMPAGYSPS